MPILKEFKEFALRGNVADMAIGIIIGAAFGKIVSSLVNDILMPPLGYLIGGVSFAELKFSVSPPGASEAVTINYGQFLQTILDFIIIAFAVFMLIKLMNRVKVKKQTEPATPASPPADIQLLTEIRDLLKK